MQQWNGRWRKGWRRKESLENVRRFLELWYFFISDSGQLYVKPLHHSIDHRDVQEFLDRLDLLSEDDLPQSITFDFTETVFPTRQGRRIAELLRHYAKKINSPYYFVSEDPQKMGVALILRTTSCRVAGDQSRGEAACQSASPT